MLRITFCTLQKKKKLPVERKKKLFLNVENEDLIVSHVPQKNLKREVTIEKIPKHSIIIFIARRT